MSLDQWWTCPNEFPCPHRGEQHDVDGTCMVGDCRCGQEAAR